MTGPIAQIVVGLPVEGPFDYLIGEPLRGKISIGHRVKVSFNRQKRVGYVVGFKEKSTFKYLNTIIDALDTTPSLDAHTLALTEEFAAHYGCSQGEAIEAYLPASLRGNRKTELPAPPETSGNPTRRIFLHDHGYKKRWDALKAIVKESLSAQRSVIFVLPDKAFIDTVAGALAEWNERLCVLKEKLPVQKELDQWVQLKTQGPFIVIGTRRAVFAPVRSPGAIVIFEEENYGFKHDQSPNYHAAEVASMRVELEGGAYVSVSSAPMAETWRESKSKSWETITLKEELSAVQLIDMANYKSQSSLLSFPLQNHLYQILDKRKKVLLFMNRRGFSTMTRCNQCGHTMRCPRCNVSLSFTYGKRKLICRHCNYECDLPKICPNCSGAYMRSMGTGIEKLESDIARYYPQASVAHYDRESKAFSARADVTIATQAVLKLRGVYQPDIVAVLDFDSEINHVDFRSAQRAFSLLVHLGAMAKEKLMVQTRNMDNYCLKAARKWDFDGFYREELKLRKELQYPPYAHLLAIVLRGEKEDAVAECSQRLYEILKTHAQKSIELNEPSVDFMPKLRDQYRYTIMLKSKNLDATIRTAKKSIKELKKRSVIITLNVDP